MSSSHKLRDGTSRVSLISLPAELFISILIYLPNRDIKSLRLTCLTLVQMARLRLNRAFLSANPRNIEVFCAIADNEKFRHDIVEIIWDDVRLIDKISERELEDSEDEDWGDGSSSYEGIPLWFEETYKENVDCRRMRGKNQEKDASIHILWEYYQHLLQQQKIVLENDGDVKAFKYGLQRFSRLRRVTITPAAHGVLDVPLYETPMIRAFPPGFNYPVQYTWPPYELRTPTSYIVPPWSQEEKTKWRGFCVVSNELAKMPSHNVSELVINVHTLHMTGLTCRIFDQPCEEYDSLVSLLQRPGFTRIDLTLLADGQWSAEQAWSSFRSGLLKGALDAASSDLKHFSLQVNVDYESTRHFSMPEDAPFAPEHLVPLKMILPAVNEKWKKLQHFGLSGLLVRDEELFNVLADLPGSVRSVELSFLEFMERNRNGYHDLLVNIRDKLGWNQRAVNERPVLIVHQRPESLLNMQYTCYDKAVNDFLYHGGMDPFRRWTAFSPAPCSEIWPFRLKPNTTAPLEILE